MKIGILYYGSLYNDFFLNKKFEIVKGPKVKVRLSGIAFEDTDKIRLTRNINPYGDLINTNIILLNITSINELIDKLKKREYYKHNDIEPIAYIKKKENSTNDFTLHMPIFNYTNEYLDNIKYMYITLKKYCIKYNCKYILFISYIDRISIYNIKNNLSSIEYEKKIIKLLSQNNTTSKILLQNTNKYLLKCDPNSYTKTDKLILNLYKNSNS